MFSYHFPVSPTVTLHYRENRAAHLPALLLLHSLSDNTYVFEPVIRAGLQSRFRVIAPDMRGRGLSSRPPAGYSLEDHCADLIALMDKLQIEKAYIAGHSFGGLLALYFAAHYPERVLGLAMIDAAAELHPATPLFVLLLGDRLGRWYPSEEAYLLSLRAMPFITRWDDFMRRSFLADTVALPDGSLYINTRKVHIAQCALAVQAVSKREWRRMALAVPGPAVVLCASVPFLQAQPILFEHKALETAVLLPGGRLHTVPGNHVTMLFGEGAVEIARRLIECFAGQPTKGKVTARLAAAAGMSLS